MNTSVIVYSPLRAVGANLNLHDPRKCLLAFTSPRHRGSYADVVLAGMVKKKKTHYDWNSTNTFSFDVNSVKQK